MSTKKKEAAAPAKKSGSGSSLVNRFTQAIIADSQNDRPRVRTIPAPTQLMQMATGFNQTKQELEDLRRSAGGGIQIDLGLLESSPYQIGGIVENRVLQLIDNFRANPQNTPIVVRPLAGGRYQIIAGHHRAEAFRRLGRKSILAVVTERDDADTQRLVFYDNLLAPNLPPYHLYLGMSNLKRSFDMTIRELVESSGFAKVVVQRMLSFEKMPAECHSILEKNPDLIPLHIAEQLASFAEEKGDVIAKGLQLLAADKLKKSEIVEYVRTSGTKRSAPEKRVLSIEKNGVALAKVTVKAGVFTVQPADKRRAKEFEAAIQKAIEGLG